MYKFIQAHVFRTTTMYCTVYMYVDTQVKHNALSLSIFKLNFQILQDFEPHRIRILHIFLSLELHVPSSTTEKNSIGPMNTKKNP